MNIQGIVVSILPILVAITIHEVSHGFVANKLGDPTAKFSGRLTLNPLVHIDLVGTIIMPVMLFVISNGQFIFGYAKPVPINPMNFKNPRRDMAISAAAGPVTNMILAVASEILLGIVVLFDNISGGAAGAVSVPLALMFNYSVKINIVLAVINMMPIPPLDGGRVLVGFLPHQKAVSYSKIEPYGFIIVLLLFVTGIAHEFIYPIINLFYMLIKIF